MRRIPDALLDAPDHAHVQLHQASLVAYVAVPPPPPTGFLVRQPTLSFVRSGIKHLQPHGASEPVIAPAGSVVAMGAGVHLMTELSGTEGRFESSILSVTPELLRSLLGRHAPEQERAPAAVAEMPERVFDLLEQSMAGEDADLHIREALLVAAGAPAIVSLLRAQASAWGDDESERLRAVMQAHYDTPLSLPEYAALAAMSLSTFKRRFREVFREAPGRWLHQARLQRARWLLLVEKLSVTDTCYASGFGDLSNFIRAFRRHFGLAPRAYRAAHPDLVLSGPDATP